MLAQGAAATDAASVELHLPGIDSMGGAGKLYVVATGSAPGIYLDWGSASAAGAHAFGNPSTTLRYNKRNTAGGAVYTDSEQCWWDAVSFLAAHQPAARALTEERDAQAQRRAEEEEARRRAAEAARAEATERARIEREARERALAAAAERARAEREAAVAQHAAEEQREAHAAARLQSWWRTRNWRKWLRRRWHWTVRSALAHARAQAAVERAQAAEVTRLAVADALLLELVAAEAPEVVAEAVEGVRIQ